MLLILMYHQIVDPLQPYGTAEFKTHLQYLQDNFPLKIPGSSLEPNTINICLTFDDAYFDFYHSVFPILRQMGIPAVLGIPTSFIPDTVHATTVERLSVAYPSGILAHSRSSDPLCSWQEIKEMIKSGLVIPASHSSSHADLTNLPSFSCVTKFVQHELVESKQLLEQKLSTTVDTFIFPYGKMSAFMQQQAKTHYKFLMRIGGAINLGWDAPVLYRLDAQHLWPTNEPIDRWLIQKARLKYWLNQLRNK